MGGITRSVPISQIEHAVQCELKEFLESGDKDFYYDYDGPKVKSISDLFGINRNKLNVASAEISNTLLQFDQPAQITLTAKTDMEGKVTAGGVNFKQLGVGFLANAISVTKTSNSAAPSFQTYLQGTGELSAAPVVAIPQTSRDVWPVYLRAKDNSGISVQNLQIDDDYSENLLTRGKNYSDKSGRDWAKWNDYFRDQISRMAKYHEEDQSYEDVLKQLANEDDFNKDFTIHQKFDASYQRKHQPTNVLIKGLWNVVCPGYPEYTPYDPRLIGKRDNNNIKDAADPANTQVATKYFSIKQWLFDFFTANMVWEPSKEALKVVPSQ